MSTVEGTTFHNKNHAFRLELKLYFVVINKIYKFKGSEASWYQLSLFVNFGRLLLYYLQVLINALRCF